MTVLIFKTQTAFTKKICTPKMNYLKYLLHHFSSAPTRDGTFVLGRVLGRWLGRFQERARQRARQTDGLSSSSRLELASASPLAPLSSISVCNGHHINP
mgnify:CR=1 FL=1